jgi:hypothetical protein
MGDRRRFNEFGNLIVKQFPYNKIVADIAGGKGYLNLNLSERGYNVTTFDNPIGARVKNIKYNHRFFNSNIINHYDLLVGMHPDGATDLIIEQAWVRKIPFAIVPCCIYPRKFKFEKNISKIKLSNLDLWLEHLIILSQSLNFVSSIHELKINGRNIALIGRPT